MAYFIQGTEYQVVYCANVRVGSSATAKTLLGMGAANLSPDNHHDGIRGIIAPDALIVETVRHHCDVIMSQWYAKQRGRTIDSFVNLILDGEYHWFGAETFYGKFGSNYIMRYESIQHEFDNLCIIAGLPVTELSVTDTHRPARSDWRKQMPLDLIQKVCDRYSKEMEKYGYGSN